MDELIFWRLTFHWFQVFQDMLWQLQIKKNCSPELVLDLAPGLLQSLVLALGLNKHRQKEIIFMFKNNDASLCSRSANISWSLCGTYGQRDEVEAVHSLCPVSEEGESPESETFTGEQPESGKRCTKLHHNTQSGQCTAACSELSGVKGPTLSHAPPFW